MKTQLMITRVKGGRGEAVGKKEGEFGKGEQDGGEEGEKREKKRRQRRRNRRRGRVEQGEPIGMFA